MFKRNVFLRLCALCLASALLAGSFSGCRRARTHQEVLTSEYDVWLDEAVDSTPSENDFDATDSTVSSGVSGGGNNDFLLGGTMGSSGNRISLEYLDSILFSAHPTFVWSQPSSGQKVNLRLVDSAGKTVFDKRGLTGVSYKCEATLENGKEYTLYAGYTNADGSERVINTIGESGKRFLCVASTSAADGKDYKVDGSVSLEVMNNYLDRAVTYSMDIASYNGMNVDEMMRFLLSVGAKYVQRAAGQWYPDYAVEKNFDAVKSKIDAVHSVDPDIIFEACIFECVTSAVNNIPIPEWVFRAFGQPVEKRNFDLSKMQFEDGYGVKYFDGGNGHIPDITNLETQMFVYYRAARFIDTGFEALHLGQVLLTGKEDDNNQSWTKVIRMIRDYARKNARRHYVFINAHNNDFRESDGTMLVDMIVSPIRPKPADDEVDHAVSETNPQRCVLEAGYWGAPYGTNIAGKSPSGWYSEHYPYLLEFDNYGNTENTSSKNSYVWGKDEITWYIVQPQWYRKTFMNYVLDALAEFNDYGHVSFVGYRGQEFFANNPSDRRPNGQADEDWIRECLAR